MEVIQAEWQAVLNTPTEHDFQGAFKNGSGAGNGAYARKGTTSSVCGGGGSSVGPKLFSDQMATRVPGIIDGSLC
jgi:hypothetical protein